MKAVVFPAVGDLRLQERGCCSYCRAGYFAQGDNANPGGQAMNENLTIRLGNCNGNHRKYAPHLVERVAELKAA